MSLDLLTFGEALVEIMRTEADQPLHQPGAFVGPYPSGAPFIFAVQAARLGARAAAIGAVGDDAFGRCLRSQLDADGVDMRGLHILSTQTTGVAFIAYRGDGSRDFVFHLAQAAAGQLGPDMLDAALFDGLRCLHISGSALSINANSLQMGIKALEMAQQAGSKISFDPNIRPQILDTEKAAAAFQPFLAAADVILPTVQEALALTGESETGAAAQRLLDHRPERIVVIKDGAAGCTLYTQTGKQTIPGYRVEEIDPTGAGDCFDAGFLIRWLEGTGPLEAARFGNACGALAVMAMGPMAGARARREVEAFMTARQKQ